MGVNPYLTVCTRHADGAIPTSPGQIGELPIVCVPTLSSFLRPVRRVVTTSALSVKVHADFSPDVTKSFDRCHSEEGGLVGTS